MHEIFVHYCVEVKDMDLFSAPHWSTHFFNEPECRLLQTDLNHPVGGYSLDQLAPNYDISHHFPQIKRENHISFGDQDNVSLYFSDRKDDFIKLEEGERKKMRRERNKVAASKCRNKRKEHIKCLMKESDDMENKNVDLQTEISSLQAEIRELECILDSHTCIMKSKTKRGE
ncbi:jun dimerization protein 2 isoform X1 [Hydra vulgaris]|uniref:jun dimerization protein 2 isoform X1 n=1 Tax=Hydra vulgaris TaxID=6087 RepID=UPI001F5FDB8B|nr:jun dimerization protein 2 isoform X1 [Hydra vulgaris]